MEMDEVEYVLSYMSVSTITLYEMEMDEVECVTSYMSIFTITLYYMEMKWSA